MKTFWKHIIIISPIIVLLLLDCGIIYSDPADSDKVAHKHTQIMQKLSNAPHNFVRAAKIKDEYLNITLDLPERVDREGISGPSKAIALVRITNVSKWPVALPCDNSPRIATSIHLESISFIRTVSKEPANARELEYDLGDVLGREGKHTSLYILKPGEVVETRIDVSPILYIPSEGGDYFAVHAELRSTNWGWALVKLDYETHVWCNRSITTEQKLISVIDARE